MSRSSELTKDIRAPFLKGAQFQNVAEKSAGRIDNNYAVRYRNAADTADVEAYRVDVEDNLQIGGALAVKPTRIPAIFRASLNGAIVTTRFHIQNVPGRVVGITEIHNVAGDHTDAVTLQVTKETSGQAPGAGVALQSGTFNLKGTANTKQTATLSSAVKSDGTSVLELVEGDMLSVKLTGNAQTAAGVLLIVWIQPYVPSLDVSFYSAAVTSQDQGFFIANRPYRIRAIRFAHATAETTDTTSNVQVTVDDGTEAPGAGNDLLTNDGGAGFDLNATANVPQVGAFSDTTLIASERLGIDFNSSNTEGAGICITVSFYPQANRLEIPYWLYDGNNVDMWVFDADRDYDLYDGRFLHAVAAGGTSTLNLEKANGTTNASGGTATLNTAVNLESTANTVQVADFVTVKATTLVPKDYRLSFDFGHTEQSTVGFFATISLLAR
jgi:hypothetical protein